MMKFFYTAFILWGVFLGGMSFQKYRYGEVRVFTNVVIPGDPLNHGQKMLAIKFPAGVTFEHLTFPGGCEWPNGNPRWVEVLEGGREKTWFDQIDVGVQ